MRKGRLAAGQIDQMPTNEVISLWGNGVREIMTRETGDTSRGFLTPDGLTMKQEAFARAVANGATYSDAYRTCYNVKTSNLTTINTTASQLMANPKIANRVKALLVAAEERMMRDGVLLRKHVIKGLMKESVNEDAKPAERIRALELIGKIDVVSMFKDRVEERTVDNRKPEDIEAELRQKLRDMFTSH